jgi:hypothetical protein
LDSWAEPVSALLLAEMKIRKKYPELLQSVEFVSCILLADDEDTINDSSNNYNWSIELDKQRGGHLQSVYHLCFLLS